MIESVIDFVFFDVGETLLRPYPSFEELFVAVCAEVGLTIELDAVVNMHDATRVMQVVEETGIRNASLDPAKSKAFWTALYRKLLDELGIENEDLVDRLYRRFSSSASYKLFDDVLPTLSQLKSDGFRLGVISNFDEWLEDMLVELEIGDLLDVSVISGTTGVEKPDPRIFQIAIERAEVDPSRAVHVGDSIVSDVRPAAEMGMVPVLLDRTGRYPDERCATIGSLRELPALLGGM
jgi:putative hydrolase of the HAD superfamily